jgi:hypothetical protein
MRDCLPFWARTLEPIVLEWNRHREEPADLIRGDTAIQSQGLSPSFLDRFVYARDDGMLRAT